MNAQDIRSRAQALAPELTRIRHALHRIPEPGFEEFKTQALICRELDAIGVPYTCERTWVIGMIQGAKPGRCVALRADMDALPIQEQTGVKWASTHPGYMHACGHDTHVTMLLGAARLLKERRDELHGCVKLFFQPAEETVGGAEPMIAAGCMENPHVDVVYGLHINARDEIGSIGVQAGAISASSDELRLSIRGRSGHGAHPEGAVDAIVAAAQVISALQTLVSRNVKPGEPAVVSIGSIHGGEAHNVICDEVVMRGTLRTLSPQMRAYLMERITQVTQSTAAALGAQGTVEFLPGYCALINHKAQVERVQDAARMLFGEKSLIETDGQPSMGVEDFAYFVEHTPGAFFGLGARSPEMDEVVPGHNARFLPDDRALPYGTAMLTYLAMTELR